MSTGGAIRNHRDVLNQPYSKPAGYGLAIEAESSASF